MSEVSEGYLLELLEACAACAPAPLYPAEYAKERNIDRAVLDAGLDELRRRGLVKFTEWVRERGQGYTPTELGRQALTSRHIPADAAPEPAGVASAEMTAYDRGEQVRGAVLWPGQPYASWTLLLINVLFFLGGGVYVVWHGLSLWDYSRGECISERNLPVLYELGALWPPRTVPESFLRHLLPTQWVRLILFLFLHAGLLHLMFNMSFLATISREIEAMWGWHRFLAIYFSAGIVSGCTIILISRLEQFRSPAEPITVGASGPIYGLFTAMAVWFSLNYEHLPDNLIEEWSQMIGINLVLLMAVNFVPSVSWQGHFGGAVGGFLAAMLLHVQRFHPSTTVRWLALAAVPLVPAAFLAAVFWQAGWF